MPRAGVTPHIVQILLDDPARVHHRDHVCELRDHAHVLSDPQDAGTGLRQPGPTDADLLATGNPVTIVVRGADLTATMSHSSKADSWRRLLQRLREAPRLRGILL